MTLTEILNQRFGDPVKDRAAFEAANMELWNCKEEFPNLAIKRMYVNRYITPHLRATFTSLENKDLLKEIETFDGCWNVRPIRGYKNLLSMHSFGIAVDFNASNNPLGCTRQAAIKLGLTPFSEEFIKTWEDTGWVVGAKFKRNDLMHFEYTKEFRQA